MPRIRLVSAGLLAAILLVGGAARAGTLDAVRARGRIIVGVGEGSAGFAQSSENGAWRGLEVDTARAISAAVFGRPDQLDVVPLTPETRFTALQSGDVDVLMGNTARTLTRETALGLNFAHVTFHDGQAFMVRRRLGVQNARELNGATVCVLPGSSAEFTAADYFRAHRMMLKPVLVDNAAELKQAFFDGRCDCMTANVSQLAAMRASAPNPDDYAILPEIISRQPLAPAVRHGDDQWFDIVNFAVMATIEAEFLGITSQNADALQKSTDPRVQRFLGVSAGNGKALGLDEQWAYRIVKQVGNYGEIFERNVGLDTPLKLERGLNALWIDGGLMVTPPFK
jgi:general L-amino acid transport system substrate-binding protein